MLDKGKIQSCCGIHLVVHEIIFRTNDFTFRTNLVILKSKTGVFKKKNMFFYKVKSTTGC